MKCLFKIALFAMLSGYICQSRCFWNSICLDMSYVHTNTPKPERACLLSHLSLLVMASTFCNVLRSMPSRHLFFLSEHSALYLSYFSSFFAPLQFFINCKPKYEVPSQPFGLVCRVSLCLYSLYLSSDFSD
jgi:hypothetical protein